jgi:NADPH-dependent F420 reductase
MRISIIGATGDMGYGLALRWARLGHDICIGSRQLEKAQEAAAKAREEAGCDNITGLDNVSACKDRDLIVISVPAAGHRPTLETLKDAIGDTPVLDVTIPMAFNPLRYAPPAEGSNALEVLEVLGENAKVAAGFHTVSAAMLCNLSKTVAGDLLVVGNDDQTVETILALGNEIGLRGFHAGGLNHASTLEALTPMIIGMNKRYKRGHIGICLTGI